MLGSRDTRSLVRDALESTVVEVNVRMRCELTDFASTQTTLLL